MRLIEGYQNHQGSSIAITALGAALIAMSPFQRRAASASLVRPLKSESKGRGCKEG